jgi:dihydrolipoamide dehydrogenase
MTNGDIIKTDIAVLGGGPGGYNAAFRAADLGKKVTLIEQEQNLGGVCLNAGCIPSKTLLHTAYVLDEVKRLSEYGIDFAAPNIDLNQLHKAKDNIVKKLTLGLKELARKRNIVVVKGYGAFASPNELVVKDAVGDLSKISFTNAIIATGSTPIELPFAPKDSRIMDSTAALNLHEIPKNLLIVGGGYIGLEMATFYCAFGSRVTVVEQAGELLPGVDPDLIEPWKKYNKNKNYKILLATKVTKVEAKEAGLLVTFAASAPKTKIESEMFDRVLVAIGRKPHSQIGLDKAGITTDQKGFIVVNHNMQTNVPHIFAVGDVIGSPMLAHKASREGKIVAEIIAGLKPPVSPNNVPGVIYTDPEIATVGLTESFANLHNVPYEKAVFPWQASGRSLSLGRKEGLTKLLLEPKSKKIMGGAVVGSNASELITEITMAIQLGLTVDKIAGVIHPHPTLSETIMLAAEMSLGTITDLKIDR